MKISESKIKTKASKIRTKAQPKISMANAMLKTTKLTTYAVTSSIITPTIVHFLPTSSRRVEIEARHGTYKSENTKKDKTEAYDAKYTTLVGRRMDSFISCVEPASMPLNIAIDDTTTSFAISPARSADTTAQLSKPSGAKQGAKNLPSDCKMLPSPFAQYPNEKLNDDSKNTITFIAIITEPIFIRNCFEFARSTFIVRLSDIWR